MSRLSEVTQEQRDRLRENTIRMTASGLPFISYKGEDGQFKLGDKDVTDSDFMAVIDRSEAVWICFLNGTVKELARVNMMDGEIPPKPKGYDDRKKWEKWEKGKNAGEPKDPLMLQYELPLITNDDDGRLIVFKASTKLAKEAVQRLLDAVNANDELRRPFVTLTVAPKSGQRPPNAAGLHHHRLFGRSGRHRAARRQVKFKRRQMEAAPHLRVTATWTTTSRFKALPAAFQQWARRLSFEGRPQCFPPPQVERARSTPIGDVIDARGFGCVAGMSAPDRVHSAAVSDRFAINA